jgi:hypothetical protein
LNRLNTIATLIIKASAKAEAMKDGVIHSLFLQQESRESERAREGNHRATGEGR